MPHMLPVFQRVFKDCGDNVTYHVTEDDFNGRYYQATCNLQVYSDTVNPYRLFMTNLLEDLRGIQMIKHLQVKAKDALFVGMFPLHACLNHSCCHNVDVRDGGSEDATVIPGVMVVANRDISAGEELFTTYINPQMLRSVRRAWLYKSFNFWCQCPKCNFEGDDNTYCSNCMQTSDSPKGFQGCGKCKQAFYCSVKCQKVAWKKGHKQICQPYNKDNLSITYEIDKSVLRI